MFVYMKQRIDCHNVYMKNFFLPKKIASILQRLQWKSNLKKIVRLLEIFWKKGKFPRTFHVTAKAKIMLNRHRFALKKNQLVY